MPRGGAGTPQSRPCGRGSRLKAPAQLRLAQNLRATFRRRSTACHIMWSAYCLTLLTWMTLWSHTTSQEYLPPKIGGGKKPVGPASEPTLPANYDFSYDVQDNAVSLDFGHNEKRKDDRATGSYHVLLPDGRTQLVEYEAGPDGYKPQVMYMGTATFPAASGGSGGGSDKFDGYHYNAASNRQSVRSAAPRGSARQPAPPPPAPAPPVVYASSNATK